MECVRSRGKTRRFRRTDLTSTRNEHSLWAGVIAPAHSLATDGPQDTLSSEAASSDQEIDNSRNIMFTSDAETEKASQFGGVVGQKPGADQTTWHGRCDGGACVEVAVQGEAVLVRSSTAPEITLTLTRTEWREFLTGAKQGQFDRL